METYDYFLNCMGPVRKSWQDKYEPVDPSITWMIGRIDVGGPDLGPYGTEYSMPIVSAQTWGGMQDFLWDLLSVKLLTFDELKAMYIEDGGVWIQHPMIKKIDSN